MASGRPGLILDRDGVINHDTGYLHRIKDCRFVDGIFEMVAAFAAQDFAIIVATNQSGIGRGLYTEEDFARLMDWMRQEFARHGGRIDAVYHDPTHPTEGLGSHRRASSSRKPGPGMILQAAIDLSLDLARSYCVGDQMRDIEAGRAAGIGTLVLYDPSVPQPEFRGEFWVVPTLADVTGLMMRERKA